MAGKLAAVILIFISSGTFSSLVHGQIASKCGIRPSVGRVVAGETAVPHSWPWMVVFLKLNSQLCGGTLINERWVLTAAHCFKSNKLRFYKVVIGAHHYKGVGDSGAIKLGIKSIKCHSNYVHGRSHANDICLIELSKSITLTDKIRPACLDDGTVPKDKCFVTGWGKMTPRGPHSKYLMEAEVPVLKNSQCRRMLPTHAREITDSMICAGSKTYTIGTCQGDSGGPLICSKNNVWYLVGITSWGLAICDFRNPGVYTRVSSFRSWISSVIDGGNKPTNTTKPGVNSGRNKCPSAPQQIYLQRLGGSSGNIHRFKQSAVITTSPGFKNGEYSKNLDCVWKYFAPKGKRLRIKFLAFQLEPDVDCDYDHVKVEGLCSRFKNTFCGSSRRNTKKWRSSCGRQLIVKFHTDGSDQFRGFKLRVEVIKNNDNDTLPLPTRSPFEAYFNLVAQFLSDWKFKPSPLDYSCNVSGQTFKVNKQFTLYSPGYSRGKYAPNTDCVWNLNALDGQRLKMRFIHIDMEHVPNCGKDYVKIENLCPTCIAPIQNCSTSTKTCGTGSFDRWRTSCGPQLRVTFHSDSSIEKHGFKAVVQVIS